LSRGVRARTFLSLALSLLAGCAKPTEVELRLYPCGTPERVDLAVQGYDADGVELAPLQSSFVIADSGVFSDDYATVGLRKPDGMVTADFTLTWHGTDDSLAVVTLAGVAVPAAGEVLELGAADCMPIGMTTSEPTGTDPSTGTSTSSGTLGMTTTGSSTDTSTSTGTSTTGSSTDTTGESTSTTGESTGTTGESTTDDTTTGGGDTLAGMPCDPMMQLFACNNGGPGQVGEVVKCQGNPSEWEVVPPSMCVVSAFCSDIAIADPVAVGCSGGLQFACLCTETPPVPCDDTEVPCSDPEMNKLTLCVDFGDGEVRTQTHCGTCNADDPDKPYCMD
jgi:hypothetical protein